MFESYNMIITRSPKLDKLWPVTSKLSPLLPNVVSTHYYKHFSVSHKEYIEDQCPSSKEYVLILKNLMQKQVLLLFRKKDDSWYKHWDNFPIINLSNSWILKMDIILVYTFHYDTHLFADPASAKMIIIWKTVVPCMVCQDQVTFSNALPP